MIVRYLRYGSSGFIDERERSKFFPSSLGDQSPSDAPRSLQPAAPCTFSIATRRVLSADRPASVALSGRDAGTMASRSGRPIEAPMPLSIVRREMCFPVMKSIFVLPRGGWLSFGIS